MKRNWTKEELEQQWTLFEQNISSFAAIIVDRIMLKSPYYEDGDA